MDPKATMQRIIDVYPAPERDAELVELARAYNLWTAHGGFTVTVRLSDGGQMAVYAVRVSRGEWRVISSTGEEASLRDVVGVL